MADHGVICPKCSSSNTKLGGIRGKIKLRRRILCNNCKYNFTVDLETVQDPDHKTNVIYNHDSGTAVVTGQAATLDDMIAKCKIDTEVWEAYEIESRDNKWDVTMKLQSTEEHSGRFYKTTVPHTVANQQFYFKVKFRRISDIIDWDKFKAEFKADMKAKTPVVRLRKYKPVQEKNSLELDLFDLHFGKLGWWEETGHKNFNSKEGRSLFLSGIEGLLNKASHNDVEEICFPVGNDFYNSDYNVSGLSTTHKGTPQQDDSRWQQVFREGRKIITDAISMLEQVAPVKIIIVPGNHDFQKSFFLGDVLEVKYENNQNVTVNNSPNPIKYYEYGNNLIGYCHGEIQIGRLLSLMPHQPAWGRTKFHEWHLGHVHHKKKWKIIDEEDHLGIIVRYMRSLTGQDAWHNAQGFDGAIRGCEAFIWNLEMGLSSFYNYNIKP